MLITPARSTAERAPVHAGSQACRNGDAPVTSACHFEDRYVRLFLESGGCARPWGTHRRLTGSTLGRDGRPARMNEAKT
jgi:hypothetical protein